MTVGDTRREPRNVTKDNELKRPKKEIPDNEPRNQDRGVNCNFDQVTGDVEVLKTEDEKVRRSARENKRTSFIVQLESNMRDPTLIRNAPKAAKDWRQNRNESDDDDGIAAQLHGRSHLCQARTES